MLVVLSICLFWLEFVDLSRSLIGLFRLAKREMDIRCMETSKVLTKLQFFSIASPCFAVWYGIVVAVSLLGPTPD
jgi:hypothetical protein